MNPNRRLLRDRTGFWASGAILVIVIAAGTLFLARTTGHDAVGARSEASPDEPDVRMTGAAMHHFNDAGQPTYTLEAPEITLFRADGHADLIAPRLTLQATDASVWAVQAASGQLLGAAVDGRDEDAVQLTGNVLLQPLSGQYRGQVTTEALTLFPDRRYAETDQAVIISGEGGRTTAAGLVGDLHRGVLTLTSTAASPVETVLLPRQFR